MLYFAIPENTLFTVDNPNMPGVEQGDIYQKLAPNPIDSKITRAQKVEKGENGWVATGVEWSGFSNDIAVTIVEVSDHKVKPTG